MKRKGYRGTSCEKRKLSKCRDGVVKTYSALESRFADILQEAPDIKEFRCNVLLEEFPLGEYCTDFVAVKTNGDLLVRECIYRKSIKKPKNIKLLDASRNYWMRRGVNDWGIVIDKKESADEDKTAD